MDSRSVRWTLFSLVSGFKVFLCKLIELHAGNEPDLTKSISLEVRFSKSLELTCVNFRAFSLTKTK